MSSVGAVGSSGTFEASFPPHLSDSGSSVVEETAPVGIIPLKGLRYGSPEGALRSARGLATVAAGGRQQREVQLSRRGPATDRQQQHQQSVQRKPSRATAAAKGGGGGSVGMQRRCDPQRIDPDDLEALRTAVCCTLRALEASGWPATGRRVELATQLFRGRSVQLSCDLVCSRHMQKAIVAHTASGSTSTESVGSLMKREAIQQIDMLILHRYGNYVASRVIESATAPHLQHIVPTLRHVLIEATLSMYGTRAVLTTIKSVAATAPHLLGTLVETVCGSVGRLLHEDFGSSVLSCALECVRLVEEQPGMPDQHVSDIAPIFDALMKEPLQNALHPFASRVVKAMLRAAPGHPSNRQALFTALLPHLDALALSADGAAVVLLLCHKLPCTSPQFREEVRGTGEEGSGGGAAAASHIPATSEAIPCVSASTDSSPALIPSPNPSANHPVQVSPTPNASGVTPSTPSTAHSLQPPSKDSPNPPTSGCNPISGAVIPPQVGRIGIDDLELESAASYEERLDAILEVLLVHLQPLLFDENGSSVLEFIVSVATPTWRTRIVTALGNIGSFAPLLQDRHATNFLAAVLGAATQDQFHALQPLLQAAITEAHSSEQLEHCTSLLDGTTLPLPGNVPNAGPAALTRAEEQ